MLKLRPPKNETERAALHDLRDEVLFKGRGRDDYDRNNPHDTTPNNHFMGLWQGDTLLGTLRIDFLDETRAALRRVAIHPDHQKRGLGSAMLKQAEAFIKHHNRSLVVSNVAEDAEPFYARQGYRKGAWQRTGDAAPNGSAVPMQKNLG